uniref:Reverse transcriptase domain-containing protein n=1 Tax=Naja naja TaxID=35670 RepID=A0A8C6XUJ4_NAJNA
MIDFCLNIGPHKNHHNDDYNFKKGNYDLINNDLSSLDWQFLFTGCNTVEDHYNIFLHEVKRVIKLYVPITTPKTRKNRLPIIIRKLQSKKRSLWRKNKSGHVANFKSQYKNLCHQIKTECTNYHIKQEENLLCTNSTCTFYNFVNNKLKDSRSIPPLKGPNGKDCNNDTIKANLFNTFFGSVFVNSNGSCPVFPSRSTDNYNDLIHIHFTEDNVEKAIHNLKPSLSIGPDRICAYFLKKLSTAIAKPLSIIFDKSFRTSSLPNLWSQATVIPIFKKGDPSLVENCRPISLCCVTCKVMELIINQSIILHLETNNLLSNKQYGFRKKLSCNLQLLHCKNTWTTQLDQGKAIDAIYTDFCKAFDSVVHNKLLLKLKSYGNSGHLRNWIEAFLSNRQQMVKIGSVLSNSVPVNSGVPQGSVLGPTLFILYINDLCDHIKSNCVLFADDVKLFNTTENTATFQKDLSYVSEWSNKCQLQISTNKRSVLHIGKKNQKIKHKLNSQDLVDDPNSVKDLGVLISNDLSARAHCNYIAKKALRVVNLILHSFFSGNITLLTRAYKTFARPILEYSSSVWNPHYIFDINTVEKVQKYFTRRVLHSSTHSRIPYATRLEILDLENLELRRLPSDLNIVYKIIHCNVIPVNEHFSFNYNNRRAYNRYKLKVNCTKLDYRKYDFSNRVVNVWNTLPDSVVSSPNPKNFNLRLSTIDLTPFLRGL